MRRAALIVVAAVLVLVSVPARANPLEARARWEKAKAHAAAPWRVRTRALLAVLEVAIPTDRYHRRALKALASACRKADLPHAAAAYEARAARLGPRADRGRIGSTLDHARGLRREGDVEAAAPLLEAVASRGRNLAPWLADRARRDQARDLEVARDRAGLEALARVTAKENAGPRVRLEVLDALGLVALEEGDERGARRALAEAKVVYREALRRDDEDAMRCAKAWLAMRLRERLP